MSFLLKALLGNGFINNLLNRLTNRWTAHGVVMLALQLEALHVLPEGTAKSFDGMGPYSMLSWIVVCIAVFFIFKKHDSRLEKTQMQTALLKEQLEQLKIQKNIQELKA